METQTAWVVELTDDEMKQLATRELEGDPMLVQDAIKVAVSEGWVTLTGEMALPHQRVYAERIVRRIPGVRGVINSILIRRILTGSGGRTAGLRRAQVRFAAPQRLAR